MQQTRTDAFAHGDVVALDGVGRTGVVVTVHEISVLVYVDSDAHRHGYPRMSHPSELRLISKATKETRREADQWRS